MNYKPCPLGMIKILTLITFAVAATSVGYGQAASQPAAASPETSQAIVKLEQFNVTETPIDPYSAANAISAARTSTSILDTPMTVDVVTPALILDLGPDVLFDVTNYFAGVSPGRGSGAGGINDRATFRGFESFGRTVDNFSNIILGEASSGDNNFDPSFLEHAELIMGPDSILAPNGQPGGTMNLITKSPQFTPGTDVSIEVGNYNANKLMIDSTGPLGDGKHMAFRVIADYQDAETYAPGTVIEYGASAQFTYKFSDTANLTIKYFGTSQRYGGTACLEGTLSGESVSTPDTVGGVTLSNTPEPGFAYNGWDGDANWSYRTVRDNTLEGELTTALGEHFNMRLAGQIYYNVENNTMAFPAPSINETWNQQTGQSISVTPVNPAALPEIAVEEHDVARQIEFQNDFAGSFEVGGVTLKPTLGWAYTQSSVPVSWETIDPNMPTANALSVYSPPIPAYSQFTELGDNVPSNAWSDQVYAFLRAGFISDRLCLTGGVSRTWSVVNDYNLNGIASGGGVFAGTPGPGTDSTFANSGVQDRRDTYIGGILFKALPNVSIYYNYSTNAELAGYTPLWEDGVQNEFGIKCNFLNNRLSISADHFEITESNLTFGNPAFNTGQSTIPFLYTDLANHGEEVNVSGGITKNLSVIASYTSMKLRDFVGRQRRNIPDNMVNILLDYRFNEGSLRNADVFVGVIHEGKVAGYNSTGFTSLGVPEQPGYFLAAYNVVNAGASYKYGRYRYNLTVDNALNSQFWYSAQARSSLSPYPGITVNFTVTVHI